MVRNIPRIQANNDKRHMIVASNSFGGEPQKIYNMLDQEEGLVWDVEERKPKTRVVNGVEIVPMDREGLNRFKQRSRR